MKSTAALFLLAVVLVGGATFLEVSHEYRTRKAVGQIQVMFDSLYARQARIYDCCCGGSRDGRL